SHDGAQGRGRVRPRRAEDVCHQRHPRLVRHAARQDRPRGGRARLLVLPRARRRARVLGGGGAQEGRQPRQRHGRARPRWRARYLLGEEDLGFMYLMQNFQAERLVACASALGGARITLDEAVAYGRERTAFGKPIIKREVWQHKFVDLYTKHEAARALTYRT